MEILRKVARVKDLTVVMRTPEENEAQALLDYMRQVTAESTFLRWEPGEFPMSVEAEREFIKDAKANPRRLFLVAEVEERRIVAACGVSVAAPRRSAHVGVFAISVAREHWGKGIGSALLTECIGWSRDRGLEKLALEVDADNEKAIGLYRKFGFEFEGRKVRDRKFADGTYKILA